MLRMRVRGLSEELNPSTEASAFKSKYNIYSLSTLHIWILILSTSIEWVTLFRTIRSSLGKYTKIATNFLIIHLDTPWLLKNYQNIPHFSKHHKCCWSFGHNPAYPSVSRLSALIRGYSGNPWKVMGTMENIQYITLSEAAAKLPREGEITLSDGGTKPT